MNYAPLNQNDDDVRTGGQIQYEAPQDPLQTRNGAQTAIAIDDYEEEDTKTNLIDAELNYDYIGITDLDDFFTRMYSYYVNKGFWCIVTARLLKLVTVAFVIAFTTFLSVFVDWEVVWNCHDQASCDAAAANLIRANALADLSIIRFIIIVFELGIIAYWFFLVLQYFYEIMNVIQIKHVYNITLGISENTLQTINWEEVVHKIEQVQREKNAENKVTRFARSGIVTTYEVMNRIMRKENYLIALINKEILNLRIPLPFLYDRHILTESLLWNLRYIIRHMFNKEFKVRDSLRDPEDQAKGVQEMKHELRKLGLYNLIASPFIFFFIIIYSFFKYSVEIRRSPSFVIERRWSTLARWKFREFNELEHIFSNRLRNAYKPANKYCDQFPVHILSIIGKSVQFLASAFAAVIIVLTTFKNPLLLYFPLLNQNLFWWLTALLAAWGIAKAVVIDEHKVFDPNLRLAETCKYTHYNPKHWHDKGHHPEVRDEFFYLFPFSIVSLLLELASILITPMILLFSLPSSAEKIVQFISEITVEPNEYSMGDICGFASFDFAMFGDELYGAVPRNGNYNDHGGVPRALLDEEDMRRSRDGKMEMSFLNFAANYPRWKLPPGMGAEKLNSMANSLKKADSFEKPKQKQSPRSAVSNSSTPLPTVVGTANPVVFDQSPTPLPREQGNPFEQQPVVPALIVPPPQETVQPEQNRRELTESQNLFYMLGSYYPSPTQHYQ